MSIRLHPHDDLATYAVDALAAEERSAVETHLTTCPECRTELAGHREALAWVVADEPPPPWLWDQVAAAARAARPPRAPTVGGPSRCGPSAGGAQQGPAAGPSVHSPPPVHGARPADGRPPVHGAPPVHGPPPADGASRPRHAAVHPRRTRLARPLIAGLAAAAVAVVSLAVGPTIRDSLDDDRGTVVAAALPVGTIEAEDGTTIARVAADEHGSYVELEQAAVGAPDRDLQLWSLDGPAPVSLGLLGAEGGREARVTLPRDTSAVAISDEPAGGSPQPTGRIVGAGRLAIPR